MWKTDVKSLLAELVSRGLIMRTGHVKMRPSHFDTTNEQQKCRKV